jgi:hypothetical protein
MLPLMKMISYILHPVPVTIAQMILAVPSLLREEFVNYSMVKSLPV